MDPNAALQNARDALAAFRASDPSIADDATNAGQDLAEAFEALDEWLSKGGFLPDAWLAFGSSEQYVAAQKKT